MMCWLFKIEAYKERVYNTIYTRLCANSLLQSKKKKLQIALLLE